MILYFQSLSWPSEAIKLLFAYFNHLIKAKSSLDFKMRTIQKFVSVGWNTIVQCTKETTARARIFWIFFLLFPQLKQNNIYFLSVIWGKESKKFLKIRAIKEVVIKVFSVYPSNLSLISLFLNDQWLFRQSLTIFCQFMFCVNNKVK